MAAAVNVVGLPVILLLSKVSLLSPILQPVLKNQSCPTSLTEMFVIVTSLSLGSVLTIAKVP